MRVRQHMSAAGIMPAQQTAISGARVWTGASVQRSRRMLKEAGREGPGQEETQLRRGPRIVGAISPTGRTTRPRATVSEMVATEVAATVADGEAKIKLDSLQRVAEVLPLLALQQRAVLVQSLAVVLPLHGCLDSATNNDKNYGTLACLPLPTVKISHDRWWKRVRPK